MGNKLIPIVQMNEAQRHGARRNASWLLIFKKAGATRFVNIPFSRSSMNSAGVLEAEEWLTFDSREFATLIREGFTLQNGDLIWKRETRQPELEDAEIKKGFFTVVSPVLDGHRTFRVKTSPKTGKTVIGLMTGRDNVKDYTYFAFVNGNVLRFFFKNQFDTQEMTACWEALRGDPAAAGGRYAREAKRCSRCGKLLTNPISLDRLEGPICSGLGYS